MQESVNPFTPESAKSIIDKFSKIKNWIKLKNKQHHCKVLLNGFPTNGDILEVCSKKQKLENHPRFHSGSQRVNIEEKKDSVLFGGFHQYI